MSVIDKRRKELGEFLQAIRKRGTPEEFGFPQGARRRTQGLRREEVAQLAGISTTWYTWIEQGRDVNMSADALVRMAQAYKLTRTERAYLFDLAGRRDPQGHVPEEDLAPNTLTTLLKYINVPAYVLGRTWNILAWNPSAEILFGDWLNQEETTIAPNLMRLVFTHPNAKQFVVDWEARGRRLVAEFRADCRSRLEEVELQALVSELSKTSAEFNQFWKQHDVLERQGGLREFNHAELGVLAYQQVTMRPVDQEQLKLVMLTPNNKRD
ncbi:MAG: helix-turn-helix transcriptional regulator [Methylophilaceae bacterium]|jgi:transcriptional regulator with XRE-family HTH domain